MASSSSSSCICPSQDKNDPRKTYEITRKTDSPLSCPSWIVLPRRVLLLFKRKLTTWVTCYDYRKWFRQRRHERQFSMVARRLIKLSRTLPWRCAACSSSMVSSLDWRPFWSATMTLRRYTCATKCALAPRWELSRRSLLCRRRRIRRCRWHPGSVAAAKTDRRRLNPGSSESREGCRWVPSYERGVVGDGPAAIRTLHPRRNH